MFTSLRAVWNLTQGARGLYGLAISALVVASCFLYLVPLIPQAVIDGVLAPEARALDDPWVRWPLTMLGGPDYVREHLWIPAVAIVAVSAIAGWFTYWRSRWSAQATEATVRRLRDRVYDHLQRLQCRYFDQARTGDLIQRCTSDVETIRAFLANQVVEIGRAIIMFFVPLPLMLQLDWRMTLVSVCLLPFIVAFSTVFFLRVRTRFEAADEAEGELHTRIQENLTGIRVVRAFGRQAHEEARFAKDNQTYRDLDFDVWRLMAWFWAASDMLTFLQKALVVGIGIWWVSRGELSVGAFFYFLSAVGMFMYPLRQMGRILADLGKATVAMGRLHAILDEPAEASPTDPVAVPTPRGEIVFDNVTFQYRDDAEPALRGLNLTIPARSTVALVGASGSGKSTIVSLLLRLYDPTEGRITFDGHDLVAWDREALRRQLAVVMQEPFLYSKSLGDNLRLGRRDASRADVEAAAHMADVDRTIESFDQGYDTLVGERGVTLSGGQRQRMALARALLQRPSVLVLDDALSAVDTSTESAILGRLRERRGDQTTVLIAHRLSTVALADQIVVLDHGQVVQQGTHAALIAQPGPYAELWRLQTEQRAALGERSREAS